MNEKRARFELGGSFLIEPLYDQSVFSREQFTDDQREIQRMVKDFASRRVRPNRDALEGFNKELSLRLLREMGELGLLGVDVPQEFGGLELNKVVSAIVVESLSSGYCPSFVATFSVQTGLGCLPIVWFGTQAQKQRYLPALVTGDKIGAYALTEPSAGSDAFSGKTTAVLTQDGSHYLLNGEKMFITNGGWADVYTVFARVDGEKFSAFLTDRDTPGLAVGPEEKKMGMKGTSTTPLRFADARVPVENLLYQVGEGATVALNVLNWGRLKLALADLGGSKVVLEEAVKHATERRQFGQLISQFDVIKGKIADMVIRIYCADSMIYRTIGMIQTVIDTLDRSASDYCIRIGEAMDRYIIESSMTKEFGSETLRLVTDQSLQIFGGYGFIEEYPMAGPYRDARIDRIWEGTNEINRQIVTGYMMKRALLEELPIREAIGEIDDFLDQEAGEDPGGALAAEVQAIEVGKRLALKLFHEALSEFGQDLKHEQQMTDLMARMFIDLYTAESTVCRVRQLSGGDARHHIASDVARVYVAEICLNLLNRALVGFHGIFGGRLTPEIVECLRRFERRLLLDTDIIQLKRGIGDYICAETTYPF